MTFLETLMASWALSWSSYTQHFLSFRSISTNTLHNNMFWMKISTHLPNKLNKMAPIRSISLLIILPIRIILNLSYKC